MSSSSTGAVSQTTFSDTTTSFGLPELIPNRVEVRHDIPNIKRLNLVIPLISKRMTYGGVTTAIRFFARLSKKFAYVRIVVTHETAARFEPDEWPGWQLDRDVAKQRSIMFLGDRDAPLAIGSGDFFVATAWATAIYAKQVVIQQASAFGLIGRRFVYLIQDYEPEFYQSSPQYAYAESTYSAPESTIAVFNSQQLANYFQHERFGFHARYVYEPLLHPMLRLERALTTPKDRLIYVYARPSTLRNGFGLIVEALKIWAATFPTAREWKVISDGEPHEDIPLGGGVLLQSRGKASLTDYAQFLRRSWVGIAFVFSVGVSYAAYDVAEFGSWVITNKWRTKDPSAMTPNLLCVDDLLPEGVAKTLTWCCERYDPQKTVVIPDIRPVFRADAVEEFPFVPDLLSSWIGADVV